MRRSDDTHTTAAGYYLIRLSERVRDLVDVFDKIARDSPLTGDIHLQGWIYVKSGRGRDAKRETSNVSSLYRFDLSHLCPGARRKVHVPLSLNQLVCN